MNNDTIWQRDLAGGDLGTSTNQYEYQTFYPTTGMSDLDEFKSFRFNILQKNINLHLRYAALVFEGKITNFDQKTVITTGDLNAPVHNFFLHLFSNCKASINGQVVEDINDPAHFSNLFDGIILDEVVVNQGCIDWLFKPDSGDGSADPSKNTGYKTRQEWFFRATTKGKFTARLPLITIFGLCENFTLFSRYTLEFLFVRGADYKLFHLKQTTDPGKKWAVKLNSVTMTIPVVKPTQLESLKILKHIQEGEGYLLTFRRRTVVMAPISAGISDYTFTVCNESMDERPQYMICAFQETTKQDQTGNYSLYSNLKVDRIFVKLNGVQYPINLESADFTENNPGRYWMDLMNFRSNYLMFPHYTSNLDYDQFMKTRSFFVFDLTKQNEYIMSTSVVCEVHVHFASALVNAVKLYCAYVSDRTLQLFENGDALKIVKTPMAIV